jgi:hypothetical protein
MKFSVNRSGSQAHKEQSTSNQRQDRTDRHEDCESSYQAIYSLTVLSLYFPITTHSGK